MDVWRGRLLKNAVICWLAMANSVRPRYIYMWLNLFSTRYTDRNDLARARVIIYIYICLNKGVCAQSQRGAEPAQRGAPPR